MNRGRSGPGIDRVVAGTERDAHRQIDAVTDSDRVVAAEGVVDEDTVHAGVSLSVAESRDQNCVCVRTEREGVVLRGLRSGYRSVGIHTPVDIGSDEEHEDAVVDAGQCRWLGNVRRRTRVSEVERVRARNHDCGRVYVDRRNDRHARNLDRRGVNVHGRNDHDIDGHRYVHRAVVYDDRSAGAGLNTEERRPTAHARGETTVGNRDGDRAAQSNGVVAYLEACRTGKPEVAVRMVVAGERHAREPEEIEMEIGHIDSEPGTGNADGETAGEIEPEHVDAEVRNRNACAARDGNVVLVVARDRAGVDRQGEGAADDEVVAERRHRRKALGSAGQAERDPQGDAGVSVVVDCCESRGGERRMEEGEVRVDPDAKAAAGRSDVEAAVEIHHSADELQLSHGVNVRIEPVGAGGYKYAVDGRGDPGRVQFQQVGARHAETERARDAEPGRHGQAERSHDPRVAELNTADRHEGEHRIPAYLERERGVRIKTENKTRGTESGHDVDVTGHDEAICNRQGAPAQNHQVGSVGQGRCPVRIARESGRRRPVRDDKRPVAVDRGLIADKGVGVARAVIGPHHSRHRRPVPDRGGNEIGYIHARGVHHQEPVFVECDSRYARAHAQRHLGCEPGGDLGSSDHLNEDESVGVEGENRILRIRTHQQLGLHKQSHAAVGDLEAQRSIELEELFTADLEIGGAVDEQLE